MILKGVTVELESGTQVFVYPRPYGWKIVKGPAIYIDSPEYKQIDHNSPLKDEIDNMVRRLRNRAKQS